jgi:hypothetical protein
VDVFLERRPSGEPDGYAFVQMASAEDAAQLIATGLPPLGGRPLVVDRRRLRD